MVVKTADIIKDIKTEEELNAVKQLILMIDCLMLHKRLKKLYKNK